MESGIPAALRQSGTDYGPPMQAAGLKGERNALLCSGISADRDSGGGIRVRRSCNCLGGRREDSILRVHRTVRGFVDHSHVAPSLAGDTMGALYW